MLRRILSITAVVGLALFGVASAASAAPPPYPPAPASGSVSPGTITAGGTVTFSGTGFQPGSAVQISVSGNGSATITPASFAAPQASNEADVVQADYVTTSGSSVQFQFAATSSATVTAKADGSFAAKITLSTPGTYTLTATGVAADGVTARVVTATVRVVAAAGSSTVSDGLPRTGASGTAAQVWAGLGLLGLGVGMVALTVARRRHTGTSLA